MKKLFVILAALALAAALSAQDLPGKGAFGLTGAFGYSSGSIGCWYNLTDNIAVKPSIGFSSSSSDTDYPHERLNPDDNYTETTTNSNKSISFGVDALYLLPIVERLVLGVGAGCRYTNTKYEYTDEYEYDRETSADETDDQSQTSNTITILALASAQYYFSRHFGAFLDFSIGVDFTNSKYERERSQYDKTLDETFIIDTYSGTGKSTYFRTATANLGVVYFF
jgi:hypothetical protein